MESYFSLKRHQPHPPSHPHSHSHSHSHSTTPQSQPPKPPGEAVFRILCPAAKIGGVIGKGGAVIRQLREDTGARIRIVDDFPHFSRSDERVIVIAADSKNPKPNPNFNNFSEDELSVAQVALVKVFERILKVDEERSEGNKNEEEKIDNRNGNGNGNGNVICRMLLQGNQVGCVLGRGGKVIDKIRQESGAHVRILPKDQIPACASLGDELIQMTGNFQVVKKALLFVSNCLQEHLRTDTYNGASIASQNDSFLQRGEHATDHHTRSFTTMTASESIGHKHRMIPEDDVVFRMLCRADKIGSLIGKGGSVVRGIENETGASIKIGDHVAPDSDERIVTISARESMDMKRSPAQDAFIRVHSRITEIGFEPGAAVIARFLVSSQQIGCLLGKGGSIIAEMRKFTGANIRIFGKDMKLTQNEELVQVLGSLQSVQDALFQITSRLREHIFPPKHVSHVSSSPYFNTYQELPTPSFRPRHDQVSPSHYQSPVGLPDAYDNRTASHGQAHPSFSQDMDRSDGARSEHDLYHYSGDRGYKSMSFERPSSPKAWHPQEVEHGNSSRFPEGQTSSIVSKDSESCQMPMVISVEVVVPLIYLPHVYGENKSNLGHITQFSGADVIVHDPKPGATEGRVVISGTPSQLHTAQSLVHAFILCSQSF